MKKFSEQLRKRSESVKLRSFERKDLRERLSSYIEYHPLPAELKDKQLMPEVQTSVGSRSNVFVIGRYASALSVFILMLVPVLAERTVPGDVLYPVKVNFNEEIRGSFALSSYEKVEWETERLERRIAEARLLATEGKLTPEREAEVAEAVKQHSDAAQKEIAIIRESDSEEAVIAEITFASALEVQSEVLEGHTENDVDPNNFGRSVTALSGAVNAARDTAVATQSNEKASYEKLSASVEIATTRAEELFYSIGDSATSEEVASIENRLAAIQVKLVKAAELNNTKDIELPLIEAASMVKVSPASTTDTVSNEESESINLASTTDNSDEATIEANTVLLEETLSPKEEAVILLKEALADTQKLIRFMTDIDVRINVSIEELVPEEEASVTENNTNTDTEVQNVVDSATSTERILELEEDLTLES